MGVQPSPDVALPGGRVLSPERVRARDVAAFVERICQAADENPDAEFEIALADRGALMELVANRSVVELELRRALASRRSNPEEHGAPAARRPAVARRDGVQRRA